MKSACHNPSSISVQSLAWHWRGVSSSAGGSVGDVVITLCFYPCDAMLARVIVIATCLSVRPSVYCVKTKKASGMISSPSGSPKTLVFCCQISSPNSKGLPPNVGLKQGSVGKIQRFSSFKRQYLENGSRYCQSYYWWLIGKSYMGFRLTLRSITLDDLELV